MLGPNGINAVNFLGSRVGLTLGWVDADTISIGPGGCVTTGNTALSYAGGNITFTALDTGTRTVGVDYAAFLTADGPKLTAISTYHASGLVPSGYTAANTCLLGYFHNGVTLSARNATGDIFQYSITSNDKLDRVRPFRAVQDLPQGVPLPGMVRIGSVAIGIYEASHEDATSSTIGSSAYPTSRYGVNPWGSTTGWDLLATLGNAGLKLPTWAEWLAAVEFNPGSATAARMNGNTAYGSASDDVYLAPPGALTAALQGSAGNLSAGAYLYQVTLTNATGETNNGTSSTAVTVVTPATNGQISLSAIPIGAAGTTARKVYRTKAGGSTYYLLTTIADNTTTIFADNIADASLPATTVPAWNTTGEQQCTKGYYGGQCLTGTGPRSNVWGSTTTNRSWYSPAGLADAVGNDYEIVATFVGGLSTSSPGGYVSWGFENDGAYNFSGQAFNPDTGGYTSGLPAILYVGGYWGFGSVSGVRSAVASYSPSYNTFSNGFRFAR